MAKIDSIMTPDSFRKWRKSLKLKQKEAAHALGLKSRMIQYYEKGERDGKTLTIPKSISLACWALSEQVLDYDGVTVLKADADSKLGDAVEEYVKQTKKNQSKSN